MTDVRKSCRLSDDAFEARRATLRRQLAPHARFREALPDGVALGFEATPDLRAALDDLVAFERECCPGLGFALRERGGVLRLEVRGVAADAPILADLGAPPLADLGASPLTVSAPPSRRRRARGWARAARAAGLGTAASFALLCLLPMGAAALLGASVVAPLAALDRPWIVAATALVCATLVWRRARARATAGGGGDGCGC
jgi:hypothetical protein